MIFNVPSVIASSFANTLSSNILHFPLKVFPKFAALLLLVFVLSSFHKVSDRESSAFVSFFCF